MKKKIYALFLGLCLVCQPVTVSAKVAGFRATVNAYKQDNKGLSYFTVENAEGKKVRVLAREDTLYVTSKRLTLRNIPDVRGKGTGRVLLGTEVQRVAVCNNGWSKINVSDEEENKRIGYVPTEYLSDVPQLQEIKAKVIAVADGEILDYPSRKDGQVIGQVSQKDKFRCTGIVNGVWSRIVFKDEEDNKRVGYIPTSILANKKKLQNAAKEEDKGEAVAAGVIHKSEGKGIFAKAVDEVKSAAEESGVQVGSPVEVSADAVLKPLGNFKITHYCRCSICCGPWADGITATGTTATTNRTIAVDPDQIPYGSKVVINGQVYVAEDCGGAITENCIDIYVASHEEGENKGVYYADVYLLED